MMVLSPHQHSKNAAEMSLKGSSFAFCETYIFIAVRTDMTGWPVRLKYYDTSDV